MTPELWQRLKPLYDATLDTPKEKRAQFVAEACGNDEELRVELEALLAANENRDGLSRRTLHQLQRLSPENRPSPKETLFLNRFRIVRLLGFGGMGEVYEAIDLELGRIALKTIRPAIAQNSSILARFKEEVLLARPISGPNVCHIVPSYMCRPKGPAAPVPPSSPWSSSTASPWPTESPDSGPVPPKEALKVAAQLCAALQSIHDAGVVHRDSEAPQCHAGPPKRVRASRSHGLRPGARAIDQIVNRRHRAHHARSHHGNPRVHGP